MIFNIKAVFILDQEYDIPMVRDAVHDLIQVDLLAVIITFYIPYINVVSSSVK